MDVHPYAKLFPLLEQNDLQALAADIKQNGLRDPIAQDGEGRIVDGRNRHRACEIAGVEPRYETVRWSDREILALVLSRNLHRRHLTESQRAMVAAELANLTNGQKPSSANLQSTEPAVTQAEAAKLLNVSPRSVATAKRVKQIGSPELQEAVTDGKVSVSKAVQIADLPEELQVDAIQQPRKRRQKPVEKIDAEDVELQGAILKLPDDVYEGEPQFTHPSEWSKSARTRVLRLLRSAGIDALKSPGGKAGHSIWTALNRFADEIETSSNGEGV